jgi:predicted GNAT family acetyltransferase
MKTTLQTFTDPKTFREAAYPVMLQNEAQNCICFGVADTLITNPERYKEYIFASFAQDSRVVGAAWQTPPFPLGVTTLPEDAIPELVNFALVQPSHPSGIVGPSATVELFTEQWLLAVKCGIKSKMAQGVFQLTQVNPLPKAAGMMRVAEERDFSLLVQWNLDFSRELNLDDDVKHTEERVSFAIKNHTRFLWEIEGKATAMAGLGGKTPNGMRITSVYTLPDQRGKGYASTLVATLSQQQLNEGKRFCFLYTDLANPTSNRIYQKMGYKMVCDSAYYTFQY